MPEIVKYLNSGSRNSLHSMFSMCICLVYQYYLPVTYFNANSLFFLLFFLYQYSNISCALRVLTLQELLTTTADDTLILAFFRENKAWHFIRITCQAEDSNETPSLVFSKNYFFFRTLSATTLLHASTVAK